MAAAAKAANLKHVIWSTLEDTRRWVPLTDNRMPTLMEHYKVPHFDGKGESDICFTEAGVPTTFLLTSFYWENFIYFGMGPKKGPDGKLAITLPMADKPLSGIAAADIGTLRVRRLQGRRRAYRQDGGHCRRAPDGHADGGVLFPRAGSGGPLQRRDARRVPRLRISGCRRPREHVPVLRGVRRLLHGRA